MSMNYLYLRTFLTEATEAKESDALYNEYNARSMKLEVSCTAATEIIVQSKINESSDWTTLNVRNVGNTSVAQKITTAGIYAIDVSGLPYIRVKLNTVSTDDKVTVVGSLCE